MVFSTGLCPLPHPAVSGERGPTGGVIIPYRSVSPFVVSCHSHGLGWVSVAILYNVPYCLRNLYIVFKNKIKNVLKSKKKKKNHPHTGTVSMSGNKISLESLTSPSPPKAFQGFLFLCKGWAMFPRISHSGHSGEPCSPTMGSGCGGECRHSLGYRFMCD